MQPVSLNDFGAQGAVAEGLLKTLADGTFVHAYLISGVAGSGKRTLARLMTQYLLCSSGRGDSLLSGLAPVAQHRPCGSCPACVQVRDGNHPDVVLLRAPDRHLSANPEDQKKAGIVVGDIREMIRIAGTHSFEGGLRVFQVEQAEKMNPAAQNCLLKTLEEPLPDTVFLLMTDTPESLLPTIISRCRHLKLHAWPDEVILRLLRSHGVEEGRQQEILRVCGGSIGQALTLAGDETYWQRRSEVMRDFFALEQRSDILRVSTAWKDKKEQSDELLDDVEDMLRTLMMVHVGRYPAAALREWPEKWQHMALSADHAAFTRLLDAVREARKLRESQVTWQAVVERLLLQLMEEKARW